MLYKGRQLSFDEASRKFYILSFENLYRVNQVQ